MFKNEIIWKIWNNVIKKACFTKGFSFLKPSVKENLCFIVWHKTYKTNLSKQLYKNKVYKTSCIV